MANPQRSKAIKPTPPVKKWGLATWILLIIAVICITFGMTLILLNLAGIIHFYPDSGNSNSNVQEVSQQATIGVPYAVDFSSSLIPLLPPESTGGPYTFYLGSGVGFPPMGLILGIDGVLKGTPTATSNNNFQVCVKDVGGRSACRTYHITVDSGTNNAGIPVKNTAKQPAKTCPATSCDTGECCWSMREDETDGPGPHPAVNIVAVMVEKSCDCPSDTTLSPDQIGGSYPWKRCECNLNR